MYPLFPGSCSVSTYSGFWIRVFPFKWLHGAPLSWLDHSLPRQSSETPGRCPACCCSKNCRDGQETRIVEHCDFITAGKLGSPGAKLERLRHFTGNIRQSQEFGRNSSIILPLPTQLIYNEISCLHITFTPLSPYIFYFYIVVFRTVLSLSV